MNEAAFGDSALGIFTQDPAIAEHVVGSCQWCGKTLRLVLSRDGGTYEQAATHAVSFLEKQRLWNEELNDRIHSSLYETWDECWRQDGEPLDKDQWLARLELYSIEVSAEGYLSAWYRDGDLFWGHLVNVFGKLDSGTMYADLMG